MVLLLMALAGYVAGTLIAVFLDRLYTGAPWGGPPRLCLQPNAVPPTPLNELGGAPPQSHLSKPDTAAPAADEAMPPSKTPEPLYVSEPVPWYVFTGTPGYLLARGRCPAAHRLAARLWYLPLLGAGAGAAIARYAVDGQHAALVSLFGLFLLAFAGTDFERHLLPNRLMYPALVLGVALCWAWPDRGPVNSLAGGAAGYAVMFVLFMVLPGFGYGDVKLAGLLGLVAGLSNTFPALAIGVLAGGVGSLFMLLFRRAGRKTAIAYGPYLALGAFAGMLMT